MLMNSSNYAFVNSSFMFSFMLSSPLHSLAIAHKGFERNVSQASRISKKLQLACETYVQMFCHLKLYLVVIYVGPSQLLDYAQLLITWLAASTDLTTLSVTLVTDMDVCSCTGFTWFTNEFPYTNRKCLLDAQSLTATIMPKMVWRSITFIH